MAEQGLTAAQRAMVDTWEQHMASEFETASIDATMATMTADAVVNHVPVMTGGVGARAVREFYSTYFIGHHPPDTSFVPISRTVGESRIVDELIHRFTHTIDMPWMLPGVAPTGRRVEIPVVVAVDFVGEKISAERIYWDQASVLAQVGVLDIRPLPATAAEATRKVMDPAQEPSNVLIARATDTGR